MAERLAWLLPAALALGLAVYTVGTHGAESPRTEASSGRLIGLLVLIIGCLFLALWLVLGALSHGHLQTFTAPANVSLALVAVFAVVRLLR